MSLRVKPHHLLQELLAKLLFGIETVSVTEQKRMVNRACREAAKWYDAQNTMVESKWSPRSLTTVITFKNDCPIDDEVIFPALRHAKQYVNEVLIRKFGDKNGWISNMRSAPEDSSFVNDNLGIQIMLRPQTAQWPMD